MSIDIHQTAILEGEISFEGNNVTIGPYAVLQGKMVIGEDITIGAGCMIGQNAEHRNQKSDLHSVIVNSGTIIRENVVIHRGLSQDTVIGINCFIMNGSYIAHDCILEDGVTLSSGCRLAGHSYLMNRCNLGMGTMVHQYAVVGSYTMLGMGSIVIRNSRVEPGMKYAGCPVRFLSRNSIALEKYEVGAEELAQETERFYAML